MNEIALHYDLLIENGNDQFSDSKELSEYMDKWDGSEFINLLGLDKRKSVLEFGCGTGRIAKKVVDFCKFYVGIDISPKTVSAAKKHFFDKDNVSFLLGDFFEYPFNQKFDVVLSTLTFMHVSNKIKALEKVFELLNPNGKVVLSIDKNQQNYINTGYSKISVYPDSPGEIHRILTEVGFNNIFVKEIELAYIFSANRT